MDPSHKVIRPVILTEPGICLFWSSAVWVAAGALVELCILCNAVTVIACQRTAFCQFGHSDASRRHLQPTWNFLCNSLILETVQQLWTATLSCLHCYEKSAAVVQVFLTKNLIPNFKLHLMHTHVFPVSIFLVLQFLPTMNMKWTCYSKLALGVNEYVNLCVDGAQLWTGMSFTVYYHLTSSIRRIGSGSTAK